MLRLKRGHANYEMDMCTGPLVPKIIRYSLPLMLTGILQLLYNAADIIVVGRFVGDTALAAVSSTGSLINLIVNVFMGLSVGTSVIVARYYGAGDAANVSKTVHTSIGVSLVCGVIVMIFGMTAARELLIWMDSPPDVLDQATVYVRIYFAGMIPNMLYNFGAAILRAVGDTRRPLYYLTIAGIVNVILNVIFVTVFHMGVAGVAWATIISQAISMVLVMICLIRSSSVIHLDWRKIRIYRDKLAELARIGLPAGFQGAIFSISNVLIQSSINSFGSIAMAGNGAASNIEGFVYTAMNTFYQSCLAFTSQNVGARKFDAIGRILGACIILVAIVGLVTGNLAYLFGHALVSIYSADPAVIEQGIERLSIVSTTYAICGVMDVFVGSLRGMGTSLLPMVVSMLGACGLRILWIYTIFAADHTLFMLYLSYPVSWVITAAVHFVCYLVIKRKLLCREGVELAHS